MSDQVPYPPQQSNEEIDLGQLFTFFKRIFSGIFRSFLRLFIYFKKNLIMFIILGVVGVGSGLLIHNYSEDKFMTEVILSPQLDSKYYLYDAIEEINNKIKSKDKDFFKSLGINQDSTEITELLIEPLTGRSDKEKESMMKNLEALEPFQESPMTTNIIREILQDQSTTDQRITVVYKNPETGPAAVNAILGYLNNNTYYSELVSSYNENARMRIAQNDTIIKQLDEIIYAYNMQLRQKGPDPVGQLILEEGESLDVSRLFSLKSNLIAENETKKIELKQRKEPLSIINIGRSQPVDVPLLRKSYALIPIILIGVYILIGIVRYLDNKAKEIIT